MNARLRGSYPPAGALDDRTLAEVGAAVEELFGLQFPVDKRRDLASRLAPILVQVGGPADLAARVRSDPKVRQAVINHLTIGESYFFRNHPHFDALRQRILPDLEALNRGSRRLSIWCAGCATGEEPYSIAMLIDGHFPGIAGWEISILATDINTEFLARAERGIYPPWSFRGVEPQIVERYFEPDGERRLRLRESIRSRVRFEWFNLAQVSPLRVPGGGPFDIVLCRNVLIYFAHDFADAVVRELTGSVARDGYLLVGHAEAFPSLRELEAIYSNATYFYRNSRREERRRPVPGAGRTFSIPGLPVSVVAAPSAPPPPPRRRSTVPPPPPEPATARLARVRDLIDAGELEAAAILIEDLLTGPARIDHRAHFLAGLIADLDGRPVDALASLRQSIFLNRHFVIGHYYQGIVCEREGDPRTAARCLRNAARLIADLPPGAGIEESGGVTAGRLAEIVEERIKELEIDSGPAATGSGNGRR